MSLLAMNWAKGLTHDPAGQPITRTEKFVLLVLADTHNEHQAVAWPSLDQLAAECLISKRALITTLQGLVSRGLLTVTQRTDVQGWKLRNEYGFPALPHRGEVASPLPQDIGSEVAAAPEVKLPTCPEVKFDADRGEVSTPSKALRSSPSLSSPEEKTSEQTEKKEPPPPPYESHPADHYPDPHPQALGDGVEPVEPTEGQATEAWVIATWNAIDGVKPLQHAIGPVRERLRARLKQHPARTWWETRFALVAASDFLCGRTPREFQASLYWVLGPKNEAKLLAGDYTNRPGPLNRQAAGIRTFLERGAR